MRLTNLILLLLLIMLSLTACANQDFNYPLAVSGNSDKDMSTYQPMPGKDILDDSFVRAPRNVIYCIGDGMGFNHVAMARNAALGPSGKLTMERLPVVGVVRTYSADNLVTDSAASGTALACGIKTDNGKVGMSPDKTEYNSILEVLQKKGWRTGLVATSQISHATPASFASHIDSRDKQRAIASQLLNNRVDVMLGGGRKYWSNQLLQDAAAEGYQVIESREQMLSLKPAPVIGLFADDGMTTVSPEPTLPEMAKTAIQLLSSHDGEWFAPEPKFFLMIEGSQIDWAAHNHETDNAIRQTLLFDMAVREAIDFAQKDKQTLVIVTADHETGALILKAEMLDKFKLNANWEDSNHTGADVPLFAFGPGSEKFAGVMDNTDIPKRIAALMGIEPFPLARTQVQEPQTVSSQ